MRPVLQSLFRSPLFLALCLPVSLGAQANDTAAQNKPLADDTGVVLRAEADARVLEKILRDQEVLLEAIHQDPDLARLPQDEKERRVIDIMRRYEVLIEQRPNDGDVMVLYGKFLRLVDDRVRADSWFRKADVLMPEQAVIKHQLGAYAAEEGDYRLARGLLEAATRLAPQVAVYHYHLGEFLATYQSHLVKDGLLKRAECDAKMQAALMRAAELNPEEKGFRWRYAESFFDCATPDWPRALAVWNALVVEATTPLEKEVLGLYRARVLIGMGRRAEAEQLIETSKTSKLEGTRTKLRELLRPKAVPLPSPEVPSPERPAVSKLPVSPAS